MPVRKSSEKTKKKTAVELRLERLQEFRKQKQEKKKEEEKIKKKPWRAGLRQSGRYTFPKKEATNTRRETTTGSTKASVWKVTSINRAKVCIIHTVYCCTYRRSPVSAVFGSPANCTNGGLI